MQTAEQGAIKVHCAHSDIVEIGKLKPNPKNPNTHPQGQIEILAKVIREQGWRQPIKVSNQSGYIVSGHGRYEAAIFMGAEFVPVDYQDYESEAEELADLLADNRIAELAEMDEKMLAELFASVDADAFDMSLSGYTDKEIFDAVASLVDNEDADKEEARESLADRFIIPPTSVLNARAGDWGDRKAAWISIGINSEAGRASALTFTTAAVADPSFYEKKAAKEKELGRKLSTKEFEDNYYVAEESKALSTSIFDPALCEICYKWFSGEDAEILDPFAGGSVRGIVGALTGRKYTGIDLRPEQIAENEKQWSEIGKHYDTAVPPKWITGDSLKVLPTIDGKYDLVFSCPPYADLEQYSDDPADLSNMEYEDFLQAYREIIRLSCDRLEDNRFAVFVVGEVRDKKGHYRNFVADTIQAFRDAGLKYYNEAILVTPLSGSRFRIGRTFNAGRKLCKTHQTVLVFVKGDWRKATEHCGDISADLPDEIDDI